jgi:hypothetical protein
MIDYQTLSYVWLTWSRYCGIIPCQHLLALVNLINAWSKRKKFKAIIK